jgi:uncharacterized protein YbbC (DUF1343 family)/CubicO group peptidase (beta-lactamase class C family)
MSWSNCEPNAREACFLGFLLQSMLTSASEPWCLTSHKEARVSIRIFSAVHTLILACAYTASASNLALPDRLPQIDSAIEPAIERHAIPGAVLLIGRGDEDVYFKSYGSRSIEPARAEMTPDTIFDLASLTKPIATATSVMILADRGKVKLWEPVSKYVPEFGQNGKAGITVEDLLLHRGGLIPDNPMADYGHGVEESWKRIWALKPLKQPGHHFWYTDVGYIVLGELVRRVDGRPLDQFAREEIFQPLGMNDTTFKPGTGLHSRIAPTEKRDGKWTAGEVHDPRAYALGGVAGHAGLFGTAQDLGKYCRMILNGGEVDGKRILSASAVGAMIRPQRMPQGNDWRTYAFDALTGYSSPRGQRFDPLTTFGHTGFTGTMFWLDPANHCFVILLTNRVHPALRDGSAGSINRLRREVSTLAAEAMLGRGKSPVGSSVREALGAAVTRHASGVPDVVLCGIDVLKRDNFKQLEGRRVALITNHTGRDRDGNRTVDLLAGAPGVKLVKLFSPEHGLYGALDEKVGNTVDEKTKLPVFSLYGETRRPSEEMLEGIDTLVFDIQDVGARFYTYISTMGLCMEEAAKNEIRMVVLDRPNPITGAIVDGPVADKEHFSFICYGPIPLVHGMTIGELASLFNDEFKINCDLQVVEMDGWRRSMWFDETGLTWINPSPNMRNLTQALVYPAVCLLEATNVSMGRGADQPFETFGAPWIDGPKLAAALNGERLPGLRFVPIEFTPKSSKFANQQCQGVYIIVTDRNVVEPTRSGLALAFHLEKLFGKDFQEGPVRGRIHDNATMAALAKAKDVDELPAVWKEELDAFRRTREKHLIYK